MKTIALKVNVETLRGTREGVPRLVELFRSRGVNASFLFSLGADQTGRALGRVFRQSFMKKVSLRERYGLKALCHGTLMPGPDIGLRCSDLLRSVEAAGFEVGIHAWNPVRWQSGVLLADAIWTEDEINQAIERFQLIFGHKPAVHGAAGWLMNRAAFRLEQRKGFRYASDCRGTQPFWPVVEGEPVRCLQIPTTLPTLDELLRAEEGVTVDNVHEKLIHATADVPEFGHVFTLSAEMEGLKLLPAMECLLDAWLEQGYQIISLGGLFSRLDLLGLPYHAIETVPLDGQEGVFAIQGANFP